MSAIGSALLDTTIVVVHLRGKSLSIGEQFKETTTSYSPKRYLDRRYSFGIQPSPGHSGPTFFSRLRIDAFIVVSCAQRLRELFRRQRQNILQSQPGPPRHRDRELRKSCPSSV
jgi:hypothetical protein